MPHKTLVTGGTGFAGSHLLDRLSGRTKLSAWQRPGGRAQPATRDVEWKAVDLLDRDGVTRAIAKTKPSRIFHLAGAAQVDTSWASVVPHLQANVIGTHHLLDAVRRAGRPCRVLVVTSAQVYQSSQDPLTEDSPLLPSSPYGLSKLAEDDLALRAHADDGLDIVVARPFNHAGPRQSHAFAISSFARQIALAEIGAAPPEIHVGNLDARRDISDVRDVVEGYEHLMETATAGRPYNLASGHARRVGDLLDRLLRAAKTPVRVVVDESRMRPSDVPVIVGDASRAKDEVAWHPHIPMEQTLADTLDWWRAEIRKTA